jgi:hypothetical protein
MIGPPKAMRGVKVERPWGIDKLDIRQDIPVPVPGPTRLSPDYRVVRGDIEHCFKILAPYDENHP